MSQEKQLQDIVELQNMIEIARQYEWTIQMKQNRYNELKKTNYDVTHLAILQKELNDMTEYHKTTLKIIQDNSSPEPISFIKYGY